MAHLRVNAQPEKEHDAGKIANVSPVHLTWMLLNPRVKFREPLDGNKKAALTCCKAG